VRGIGEHEREDGNAGGGLRAQKVDLRGFRLVFSAVLFFKCLASGAMELLC